MNVLLRSIALASVLVFFGCGPHPRTALDTQNLLTQYRLGPGDQVRLRVFDQPQLSDVYNVDASGRISVPLVGSVKVGHRTTRQVERMIVDSLRSRDILKEPRLSMEVVVYRPFYILGEVKNPGQYPFVAGMVIEKAVAAAGGYTIYASKRRIRITREEQHGPVTFRASMLEPVFPGDSIYVSQRIF